jgi:hypothetical protein
VVLVAGRSIRPIPGRPGDGRGECCNGERIYIFWVRAFGPALASPVLKRTEKEETLERYVETKPDWIDLPNSYARAAAHCASSDDT